MSGPHLECPDCGRRQDVALLDGAPTFRCEGCGRPLKVPAQLQLQSRPDPTRVQPAVGPSARSGGASGAASAGVGRAGPRDVGVALWKRLLVWIVAVPVGLGVVFGIAKLLGWITTNQLLDTFTATGWSRFAPLAKILPLSALLIATIVQVSVTALERRARAPQRPHPSASSAA